jgi:hypothetical protein
MSKKKQAKHCLVFLVYQWMNCIGPSIQIRSLNPLMDHPLISVYPFLPFTGARAQEFWALHPLSWIMWAFFRFFLTFFSFFFLFLPFYQSVSKLVVYCAESSLTPRTFRSIPEVTSLLSNRFFSLSSFFFCKSFLLRCDQLLYFVDIRGEFQKRSLFFFFLHAQRKNRTHKHSFGAMDLEAPASPFALLDFLNSQQEYQKSLLSSVPGGVDWASPKSLSDVGDCSLNNGGAWTIGLRGSLIARTLTLTPRFPTLLKMHGSLPAG